MKKFSDFKIKINTNDFVGDKINIETIIDKEIIILNYKVVDSKFKEKKYDKCLHLQLEFKGEKRVLFSGSRYLVEAIIQIPVDELPITTIIEKNNRQFNFT